MLSFKNFCFGNKFSNTYLVWDEDNRNAAIIDCGNRAATIADFVDEKGLVVTHTILTHAHYDHVLYIDEYRSEFPEAAIAIGAPDVELLSDVQGNVSYLFGDSRIFTGVDTLLCEGDELMLGKSRIKVLLTPGHTPGCICLYSEENKLMFTGDTIFANGGFGRTDFKYGDFDALRSSLRRILSMDREITILAGHGGASKIGYESFFC